MDCRKTKVDWMDVGSVRWYMRQSFERVSMFDSHGEILSARWKQPQQHHHHHHQHSNQAERVSEHNNNNNKKAHNAQKKIITNE